jgi:hypothetical protein
VAIETAEDAIGTRCIVKGYPNVVLRIKHVHQDLDDERSYSDVRSSWWGTDMAPAACVCEIVFGSAPPEWGEPCTPYGHYRVAAWDLILLETAQDMIDTLATVKGYPDVQLRIKYIHGDVLSNDWDLHPWNRPYGPAPQPATCVCEIVSGTPPAAWGEPVTPFGHYRVAAKDLCLEGEARV